MSKKRIKDFNVTETIAKGTKYNDVFNIDTMSVFAKEDNSADIQALLQVYSDNTSALWQ